MILEFELQGASPSLKPIREIIRGELRRLGYSEDTTHGIALSLDETITNAVTHGNDNDPAKSVSVRVDIESDETRIRVRDEGPGFDPTVVPPAHAPDAAGQPRESGRGLFLIRSFMDAVDFEDGGRCVVLSKRRMAEGGTP